MLRLGSGQIKKLGNAAISLEVSRLEVSRLEAGSRQSPRRRGGHRVGRKSGGPQWSLRKTPLVRNPRTASPTFQSVSNRLRGESEHLRIMR